MLIRRRRGWELPESAATPERVVLGRRTVLAAAAAAGLLPAAARAAAPDYAHLPVDPTYKPGRALTVEKDAETYNNYYEFSESKDLWQLAQKLPQSPWSVRIEGMVEKPRTLGLDDLLKQVKLEERIYRHRCVEAWGMTVPWAGFPLADLVKLAAPLSGARYITFTTVEKPDVMPGLGNVMFPWPYTEGLTIEEARNDLAFIATGLYGKPLPAQNGGPIRLVVPWKYGFKSAKALVKIGFTDKRPTTFWETLGPNEYGFWANVNPAVPHPRWSQATELLLGTGKREPTQIYNGYGPFVADLYKGLKDQKLFM